MSKKYCVKIVDNNISVRRNREFEYELVLYLVLVTFTRITRIIIIMYRRNGRVIFLSLSSLRRQNRTPLYYKNPK